MSTPRPYSTGTAMTAGVVMTFVLVPVIFIALYAFNNGAYVTLPPKAPTLHWFGNFFGNPRFVAALRSAGVATQQGVFGDAMHMRSERHGPVTVVLEVSAAAAGLPTASSIVP